MEMECNCKNCQDVSNVTTLISRLEQRDSENARLINEMYAKMSQFIDNVSTELSKLQEKKPLTTTKIMKTAPPQPKPLVEDRSVDLLNITTALARIENQIIKMKK